MNSSESQRCNSVGPCSRHGKSHISEKKFGSGTDQQKQKDIVLKINSSTDVSVYVLFFCVDVGSTEPHSRAIHSKSAVKQKGRQRKPQKSSRNFVSESGRFRVKISTWLLWKEQNTILALVRGNILGQYPAAPSSPGPFVLLLTQATLTLQSFPFFFVAQQRERGTPKKQGFPLCRSLKIIEKEEENAEKTRKIVKKGKEIKRQKKKKKIVKRKKRGNWKSKDWKIRELQGCRCRWYVKQDSIRKPGP